MRFIINTEFDLNSLRIREENPISFHLINIPEMIDNCYLILCEREVADVILGELDLVSDKYEIVGSWNRKGEFYDDIKEGKGDKPKKDKDKFTKAKYKKYLKQKLVFADENDEVGTLVDATEDTLINNIVGWNRINISDDE